MGWHNKLQRKKIHINLQFLQEKTIANKRKRKRTSILVQNELDIKIRRASKHKFNPTRPTRSIVIDTIQSTSRRYPNLILKQNKEEFKQYIQLFPNRYIKTKGTYQAGKQNQS